MIKKTNRNIRTLLMIGIIFLIVPMVSSAVEKVYSFQLEVGKDDTVNLINFEISEGSESINLMDEEKDYKVELKTKEGSIIYIKYFDLDFKAYIDILPGFEGEINEEVELNEEQMILNIPFKANAAIFELSHFEKSIFKYSIEICNENNVCDGNENYLSCPNDCKSGSTDLYCDGILDGVCDQDCDNQGRPEKDIDCTCGNNICDERETVKICYEDCGVSFWQKIVNWIKSLFN